MNLFDLFIKIGVKDEASEKISKIAGGIGSGLKTAAAIGTTAVGIAASGIAALTTSAVKNYAEYEQLVGGVDTLFKGSSQRVQEYAANAFKTAGVSANTYMSTVTSFSASLLQSLGGDTQAAADLANQALTDMSDNANKMGTDMQTIINTYQSLARGNYAMLDNLKLGFGGTKAEMERLIATAANLDGSVKANDMSFGNLVQAIHVVQTEMGISGITMEEYAQLVESGAMTQEEAWKLVGTTAKEAKTTIQGSVNSMKAAWQNLVIGVADNNADLSTLIDNFVETAGTAASNILPVITNALNGAATLITTLIPQVVQIIPQMIGTVIPQMAMAAAQIVIALVNGITENSNILIEAAIEIISVLINGIVPLLPQLIEMGVQLIIALANGLAEASPELVPVIVSAIFMIVDAILSNTPALISAGFALIEGLLVGLVNSIPTVFDWVKSIPEKIKNFLVEGVPMMLSAGMSLIGALGDGFTIAWNTVSMFIKEMVNEVIGWINGAIEAIGSLSGKASTFKIPTIGTDFEQGKINQARNNLGLNVTQNIYATPQSPAELANATKAAFTVSRWN